MESAEKNRTISFIGVDLLKRLFSPLPVNKYNVFLRFVTTFVYRILSVPIALVLIAAGLPFLIIKYSVGQPEKKKNNINHKDPSKDFVDNEKITEKQQSQEKPQEELEYDKSLIDIKQNDHW